MYFKILSATISYLIWKIWVWHCKGFLLQNMCGIKPSFLSNFFEFHIYKTFN